jgi:hypothetical protein
LGQALQIGDLSNTYRRLFAPFRWLFHGGYNALAHETGILDVPPHGAQIRAIHVVAGEELVLVGTWLKFASLVAEAGMVLGLDFSCPRAHAGDVHVLQVEEWCAQSCLEQLFYRPR